MKLTAYLSLTPSEQSYVRVFAPWALVILGVLIGALGMYWYQPPGTSEQSHTVDNYLNAHQVASELKQRFNEAHREQIPSPATLGVILLEAQMQVNAAARDAQGNMASK